MPFGVLFETKLHLILRRLVNDRKSSRIPRSASRERVMRRNRAAPRPSPKVALDHCVVNVSAWQRSNDFYSRVVGVELVTTPRGPAYRLRRGQLNLHGPGAQAFPLARVPVPPGGSDICFEWPGSIDDAIGHLKSRGVEIEFGPVERFGARGPGTSVYFRDPDGSLLEFIAYPGKLRAARQFDPTAEGETETKHD
jgi:catechol 2,3-dioxygenase-like lactoylglutathione lyase family enzyme